MQRVKRTANTELTKARKEAGVYQWEIAKWLNLSEAHLSRALRYELDEEHKEAYLDAVKAIAMARRTE